MEVRLTGPLLIAAALAACGDDPGEGPPPPAADLPHYSCPGPTPLEPGTVRAWLSYTGCRPFSEVDAIMADVDAAAADDEVVSDLLDVVEDETDVYGIRVFALGVLRQMGNESGLPRTYALAWAPLPPPDQGEFDRTYRNALGLVEASAQVVACTHTRRGFSAAEQIVNTHPISDVRDLTAQRLADRNCRLR